MKCCVFVRVFYETPYVNFFIEHYLKLRFHKIIILQTDELEYKIDPSFAEQVSIHKVKNDTNKSYNNNKDKIPKNYDWIFVCDMDEILLLDEKFSDISDYIKIHTSINPKVNCFLFRWGMLEKLNNNQLKIESCKIFSNNHVKSMINNKKISYIGCHITELKNRNCLLSGKNTECKTHYKGSYIKELDINYRDSMLLHLHTRSLHNIFIKALNTKLNSKGIKTEGLQFFLDNDITIENFKKIGRKTLLPFLRKNGFNIGKYQTFNYKHDIIDLEEEKRLIRLTCDNYDIDWDLYDKKIKELEILLDISI